MGNQGAISIRRIISQNSNNMTKLSRKILMNEKVTHELDLSHQLSTTG